MRCNENQLHKQENSGDNLIFVRKMRNQRMTAKLTKSNTVHIASQR